MEELLKNRMHLYAVIAISLGGLIVILTSDISRLSQLVILVVRLCVAAYIGYWISKFVFQDVRPDDLKTDEGSHYMLYRAMVVTGALIGAGMAV